MSWVVAYIIRDSPGDISLPAQTSNGFFCVEMGPTHLFPIGSSDFRYTRRI